MLGGFDWIDWQSQAEAVLRESKEAPLSLFPRAAHLRFCI